MPNRPDGPAQGPPPGPMPNREAFDPFAPPAENGAEDGRSAFAIAFDENEGGGHAVVNSGEPREPWEPRDTPDFSSDNAEPRDTPEPRDAPEPTDTPPARMPSDQRPPEPTDEPADLDPFDVRDDDAVVTPEHTVSTPADPAGAPAAPAVATASADPVEPAMAVGSPDSTPAMRESEPTDSPPWEREPRVLDATTFSDVKDTPATERADGFSSDRTDGSDETTFMSTVDEPVQTGPSEEEQLEAARKRHVEELQQRWLITQAQLLDDPRDAVREAGLLIGDAMQFVTTTFTEHRDRIEREWKDNAEMNTDELRAIMRRYRNLFQYVLSASQLPDL